MYRHIEYYINLSFLCFREVCNFDGGDCCEDKCSSNSNLKECGHDGYKCRDPTSNNCDPTLTTQCVNPDKNDNKKDDVTCSSDEAKYRLVMYDSFGDGWDDTKLVLKSDGDDKEIFNGGLEQGSQGTQSICLKSKSTCYSVKVSASVRPLFNSNENTTQPTNTPIPAYTDKWRYLGKRG